MENTIIRSNYCNKFKKLERQSSNYVYKSSLIHFLTNNENNNKKNTSLKQHRNVSLSDYFPYYQNMK